MAMLRAIRGATTVDADLAEQIRDRTQALVSTMLERNGVEIEDLVSMIFTSTPDLHSGFPATAARALGLSEVPLLGATEAQVAGALERCIRVMLHCYSELPRSEIRHVYLEGRVRFESISRIEPAEMTATENDVPRRAQIVGLGLIGSSVALALRNAGWTVTGRDANEARAARALELDVVDALGSDELAEIAFVATPVNAIPSLVNELFAAAKRDDLIVTDVGGVKGPVATAVSSPCFVGGHPMAGSEQEGPDGADADLFVGATWVLTPTFSTDADAYAFVREIVVGFGADVVALEPARHDALVAVVSHVPHLTAANLMALAADASIEHAALLRLAAGGFRDMTRIAAGEPAIWPDIFRDNRDAVLEVLDALLSRLTTARELVAMGDRDGLLALLEYAKSARRNLPSRVVRPDAITECRIAVTDRPGELAEVTAVLGGIGVNIWDIEIAHSAEGPRGVLVVMISTAEVEAARSALVARGFRPSMRALA